MGQISLIVCALMFFWVGAKGFRSGGIKIGVFKANSDPIKGTNHRSFRNCPRDRLPLYRPRLHPSILFRIKQVVPLLNMSSPQRKLCGKESSDPSNSPPCSSPSPFRPFHRPPAWDGSLSVVI